MQGFPMAKEVEQLSKFVHRIQFEDLTTQVIDALKVRILDSIGCAIGALDTPLLVKLRAQLDDFGANPLVSIIGGGKTAPDRAAFYNGALIRYLDFNDSFLAKNETCHPSDNLSACLAACEYAHGTGKDLLTALAISYQVHCRLSQEAPVRKKGFDHTTQGAYAVAAGVSKALSLTPDQTAHAIAMAGVANNALRVTRTGTLSHWKGLAYPNTSFSATHAAFLALRGVTGPMEIFEGNKGFMETISGPFHIDWENEDAGMVCKTIIKKYNAEIHSQSTLEGILSLKKEQNLRIEEIDRIDVDIFDVAYHIIGGGEEGGKKIIRTKEEADHSLPYMIAIALLDDAVGPAQYEQERILQKDVQSLLQKITIQPNDDYTKRFPDEMPTKISITTKDGKTLVLEKNDYEGFFTKPMSFDAALKKFHMLSDPHASKEYCQKIADAIFNIEKSDIRIVINLLYGVK